MVVCASCGKENGSHYRFCLGCGNDLSSAASRTAAAPPANVACANCGHWNPAGLDACSNCGSPLERTPSARERASSPRLLVLVLLVGAVIGAVMLLTVLR
jgi:rRNA maturation endonuclease Nob1